MSTNTLDGMSITQLEEIAADGAETFYRGRLAKRLAAGMREAWTRGEAGAQERLNWRDLVLPENDPLRQQLVPSSASVFLRHSSNPPVSHSMDGLDFMGGGAWRKG